MAEAVEQAAVVLVCFSKKYQESANCKKGKKPKHLCRQTVNKMFSSTLQPLWASMG